jgi:hypothetical protein
MTAQPSPAIRVPGLEKSYALAMATYRRKIS